MNSTSNRSKGMGKAAQMIGCRRVPGGYQFYDCTRGLWVADVCVFEGADDQMNSRYRDAIQSAIYTYGKGLGLWP